MRVHIERGRLRQAVAAGGVCRQVSVGLLLLAVQAVAHLAAAFDDGGQLKHSAARLRHDRQQPEASPFRLAIRHSEYRLASSGRSFSTVQPGAVQGLSPMIERHAAAHGLDPALVHAVIKVESAYRPEAVSPKGAVGLMQVMPATGQRFGVSDLKQSDGNLKAGTAYLRHLLDRFDNLPLALAAYNAGEGAVHRFGNVMPPYPETRGYVQEVLRSYGKAAPDSPLPRVYVEGARLLDGDLTSYRLIDAARR